MRILFVVPEYPPHHGGGLLVYYRHLAPALAALGHEVHVRVAAPFGEGFPDYDDGGVRVRFLSAAAVGEKAAGFDRYRLAPQLRRFLAAAWAAHESEEGGRGFDVVETVDWGLLFAPWVAGAGGPPACVTLHGSSGQIDAWDRIAGQEMQGSLLRLLEQAGLRRAEALHTYGAANRDVWEGLTSRKVALHAPGWTAPTGGPTVSEPAGDPLVVGRVQVWKGPEVLCRALRQLGDAAPPRVLWAGRAVAYRGHVSYEHELRREFPDLWGSRVVPLGPRSAAETVELQARAAFVIVPSTWDVFNFSCAEAMAQRKVVLCSRGAGAADLIRDGENGFLFEAGDPASLAAGLRRVMALDAVSRATIAAAAQTTVHERLHPARLAQFKDESYHALARDPSPRAEDRWFRDAVEPASATDEGLRVLDALPMKDLIREAGRRVVRRALR